jgi:hypothetical protein
MVSTPKIIGLMSCGFLLCLGLSNAAPAVAADGTHERKPDSPRVGGQSGQPDEGQAMGGEKDIPHERKKDSPRVGGQSGQSDAVMGGEKDVPHERKKGGPRVGGQSGDKP